MSSGPRLLILYGSQTGTALELARRILRECRRVAPHLRVLLRAADDFDVRQMVDERLLCFVCSTTGRGEEPENMKKVPSIFIYFNLFENVTVFARSSGSSSCARTYPQPHCPLSVSECSDWGTRHTQSSTLLPKRCTGEKSYCFFKKKLSWGTCACIRIVRRRLLQLGGMALQPAGLGDDQHDLGPDAVVDPWLKNFWAKVLVKLLAYYRVTCILNS